MGVYKKSNRWYIDYYGLDGKRKREVVAVEGIDPSKITSTDAQRQLDLRKFELAQEKKKPEKPKKVKKVEKSSTLVEKIEDADKIEKSNNVEKSDLLVTRTFKIKKIWDEKLDQICYWERKQKQIVLDRILEKALKNLKYEDVPDEDEL